MAKLSPANDIEVVVSSRTDKGVHALHSLVHVDLARRNGDPFDVKYLTAKVNRNLYNEGHAVRVIQTDIVPDTFHCRYNALSRTYLYRLAIAKKYIYPEDYHSQSGHINPLPIEESHRCWFLANPAVDIDRIKDASQMLVGRHDYRTFMAAKRRNDKSDHPMYTIRRIDEITVKPGQPMTVYKTNGTVSDLYNYWDITLKGKSFIQKQVRRIVGTLVSYAQGKISRKDIYEMLTIPSKHNWRPQIPVAPPFGLYLRKVEFDKRAIENNSQNESLGGSEGEKDSTKSD